MQTALSFPRPVKIIHRSLNIRYLLPQPVVLPTLQFHFIIKVLATIFHNLEFSLQQTVLMLLHFKLFSQFRNFRFPYVNFILQLQQPHLILLMNRFLDLVHFRQFKTHVLYLFNLSVIYVRMSSNLISLCQALFLTLLELRISCSQHLLCFGQLKLNEAETLLELFVLDLCESQHLLVFVFCPLLVISSQATALT